MKFFVYPLLLGALVWLVGCASTTHLDESANVYFSRGMKYMDDSDYLLATEQFELLNAVHPFSEYAEQSLLELAYAYYANNDAGRCRIALGRLLRQYPNSEQADYALYLRGITYFEDDRSYLQDTFGAASSQRTLAGARHAYGDFSLLLSHYPNSRFARDARTYMLYIRDQLALKELQIGRFYIKRNANVAALLRAQEVLRSYASSYYVAPALELIAESYTNMGMRKEAEQTRQYLARAYPQHTPGTSGTRAPLPRPQQPGKS